MSNDNDIEKIIEGLELIEIVVPSYKYARRKGMSDDEADAVVDWALKQAIIILEQLITIPCCEDCPCVNYCDGSIIEACMDDWRKRKQKESEEKDE